MITTKQQDITKSKRSMLGKVRNVNINIENMGGTDGICHCPKPQLQEVYNHAKKKIKLKDKCIYCGGIIK